MIRKTLTILSLLGLLLSVGMWRGELLAGNQSSAYSADQAYCCSAEGK